MISTLVRGNLPQETQQIRKEKKRSGDFVYFKDREIQISKKEKEVFKHFEKNELLLRMLTGQIDSWLMKQSINQNKTSSQPKNIKAHSCDNAYIAVRHDMGPPKPINLEQSSKN
mmetsp:Transcript_9385/g.8288  ORF Transcript_9385/g.8288 Transcript_9385/m.8288 type:complete len:114 (-) Transcript_9385:65-406(-)